MDVKIEAAVATMDVLVSRVRVVIATICEVLSTFLSDPVASIFAFLSRGGVSQSAIAPDLNMEERTGVLV